MDTNKDIINWLNDALTPQELEAFKKSSDFAASQAIVEAAPLFKPENNVASFDTLMQKIDSQKMQKTTPKTPTIRTLHWQKLLMRVAAVLIIAIGIYFMSTTNNIHKVNTVAAQQETILLPDTSTVQLNAMSTIEYQKNNWDKNRTVSLNGEAFFKVAKGKKFDVISSSGTVSVIGTQFNIKQRDDFYEVSCFEGLVQVTYGNDKKVELPEGYKVRIEKGTAVKNAIATQAPNWIKEISSFDSVTIGHVFNEIERQFNVTINTNGIDTSTLFTGSFSHNDITEALKTVTAPLNLDFKIIKENNIRIDAKK